MALDPIVAPVPAPRERGSAETAIGQSTAEASRLTPTLARTGALENPETVQDSVYCRPPNVPIDTQDDVCEAPSVLKTKRTYNLSRRTIETVQALAERKVAPTQDALVELAVDELARHVREADEADSWAAAAEDPDFSAELDELEALYSDADPTTWPRP